VGDVAEAAVNNDYEMIIIADHGNSDNAINPNNTPNTAHSLNPVPFILISDSFKAVKNGKLADVAPSILDLMGIEQAKEMTGQSLIIH
jgi:2,3-bisphosphoglycerate-independent phosphoglycerate mutase